MTPDAKIFKPQGYSFTDEPTGNAPPMFEIESEPITFRTLGGPAPDPEWKAVDLAGHEHQYVAGAQLGEPHWPTLEWVVDETYWCDTCRDEHDKGHWECKQCGETVEPGMVMEGPKTITKPGRTTYKINGNPVDPETWERETEKWAARAHVEAPKRG